MLLTLFVFEVFILRRSPHFFLLSSLPSIREHVLQALFERTLEENLVVTGVLSSLSLAATAAEVSPVRRLLLVLLFDGTPNAPFRRLSYGRIVGGGVVLLR